MISTRETSTRIRGTGKANGEITTAIDTSALGLMTFDKAKESRTQARARPTRENGNEIRDTARVSTAFYEAKFTTESGAMISGSGRVCSQHLQG